MNLNKTCSCGIKLKTSGVINHGRKPLGKHDLLYLTCKSCKSTSVLSQKVKAEKNTSGDCNV